MNDWTAVEEAMPKAGVTVLVHYLNPAGNSRRVRAEWVTAAMQLEWDCDWDYEEKDLRDDWFETADNAEECWRITDKVTHWMMLPAPPVVFAALVGATGEHSNP